MRIIHIVENLDKGAVENWLINTFLESRKERPLWNWTFYCILGKQGRLDDVVRAAGGEIIYSPVSISHKLMFLQHLRKTLKTGNYDIIHSHHDYLSGFYLIASFGISFQKRLLHVHNNDKAIPVGNAQLRRVLLPVFERLAIHFSDTIVGISENTLLEFTKGKKWKGRKCCVLYYGIDLKAFGQKVESPDILEELNLPKDAKVLLFAGRMNKEKNPVFLVDILKCLNRNRQDVYGLFVGAGDEALQVKSKAVDLGVLNFIRMIGWRNDIPAIMKAATAFVFPRMLVPKEGLGLVVVEAQAAGLPMFLSNGIVADAVEIPALATFLPLNNNPEEWAHSIESLLNASTVPYDREKAYQRMQQSRFELTRATRNFMELYEN